MPPKKIPGTGEVYFSNPHTGDRVIDMQNYPQVDAAQRNEDVLSVVAFTGYVGRGPTEVMLAGIQDDFFGDPLAKSQGAEDEMRTDRGIKSSTKRQRPKLIYMEN